MFHNIQFVNSDKTFISGIHTFIDQNCLIISPLIISTTLANYLTNNSFIVECASNPKFFYKIVLDPIVNQALTIVFLVLLSMLF